MSDADTLNVSGEYITVKEAKELVRMLCHDAKELAGEFHNKNRSAKFRANWPDEYKFAETNWKTFVEAVRQGYASLLSDPHIPQADKRRMHLAIVLQEILGKGKEKDSRLQIMPNSQQFDGDKYENRKIVDKFGTGQNVRAALMNSVASIH